MKYIPQMDGLRAVAILSVLSFHLNVPGAAIGWLGVNLFFVISGFLITGILLDSKERESYFVNFYVRRALRIFPIYYVSLCVGGVAAVYFGASVRDLPYYLTYTQNYLLALKDWTPAFPAVFNHTWSLAVEEQFYALWPFLVYYLNRKNLLYGTFLMLIIGLLSRLAFSLTGNPNLQFAPLPTQVDALGAGALLAIMMRSNLQEKRLADYGLAIGGFSLAALLIVVFALGYSSFWSPYVWAKLRSSVVVFSLFSLFSMGVIAYLLNRKSPATWMLSRPLVVHIGKISYGLYIYHFPIFLLMNEGVRNSGIDVAGNMRFVMPFLKLGLTFVIAECSWRWLEQPFLRLKGKFS